MKKTTLSLAAVALLATSSFAANDLAGMFKEGKVSGQVRAGYVNQDMKDKSLLDSSAFALGGKLGYTTGSLYGISAGATFYTTQGMFKNKDDDKVDESMLDGRESGKTKSYSALGEAYLVGQFAKTTVKVGRQVIDTPLAGSDDTRMIPNTFEAALVINTDLPDTTLIAGYVSRMMGHDSLAAKNPYTKFNSMSDAAGVKAFADDKGVIALAAVYGGIKNATLQAWYYGAQEVLDAFYLQGDYKLALGKDMSLALAGQFYNETGKGKVKSALSTAGAGKIDFSVYGVKAALGLDAVGLTPYVAYNKVSEQKSNGGGTYTLGAWGGYPEFAQMEETFLGTMGSGANGMQSFKIGADYSLEKLGLGNRTLGIAYGLHDMKDKYNANKNSDMNVWDIVYSCDSAVVKNLAAKLVFESVDSKNNAMDNR